MTERTTPTIEPWLLEILRCPISGARLHLGEHDGAPCLISEDPQAPVAYPVREGVPVLLADAAIPLT